MPLSGIEVGTRILAAIRAYYGAIATAAATADLRAGFEQSGKPANGFSRGRCRGAEVAGTWRYDPPGNRSRSLHRHRPATYRRVIRIVMPMARFGINQVALTAAAT